MKDLPAKHPLSQDPVPSDHYYGCLDGDFSDAQAFDWACEVNVGRVGARHPQDIAAWVEKSLEFERQVGSGNTREVLFHGEKLDDKTVGSYDLERLIGTNKHLDTRGFSKESKIEKLYDTQDKQFPVEDFLELINKGDFHIVNHVGHGNSRRVHRLEGDRLDELQSRPAFFYTQCCNANNPYKYNWTIDAVNRPQFGPAAMISNTKVGQYMQTFEGKGNRLARFFWSKRFKDGLRTVAEMHFGSKDLLMAVEPTARSRFIALTSNLIGDPALELGIQ